MPARTRESQREGVGLARLLLADMADRMRQSETTLISRMIAEYHGQKLTWDTALATIAEIAALRRLVRDLERDVKLGEAARAEDHKRGT